MLYTAECFASMPFFFILEIIGFEKFAWMLEDLGVPIADSYVCFWLAFLLRTFTCANYTPIESLVCKGQLINSTLHALEYVYIMDNKRE